VYTLEPALAPLVELEVDEVEIDVAVKLSAVVVLPVKEIPPLIVTPVAANRSAVTDCISFPAASRGVT
jgi:hypothetical protein